MARLCNNNDFTRLLDFLKAEELRLARESRNIADGVTIRWNQGAGKFAFDLVNNIEGASAVLDKKELPKKSAYIG